MNRKKFVQNITIGEYVIHFALSRWCHHEDSHDIFGNPLQDFPLQGGDVAYLEISNSKIVLKNDIAGCFRVYWWEDQLHKEIFVTDNVFSFLSEDELNSWPKNEYEDRYFSKHGYTSGDSTCYAGINKIPPFGTLIIDDNGARITSEWIGNTDYRGGKVETFRKAVAESMEKILSTLKDTDFPIVLCFSGGVDSYYLAKTMKRIGIHFEGVYFFHKNDSKKKDLRLAQKKASELGLNLRLVDISSMYDEKIENVIRQLCYFDIHSYRYHFYGVQAVREIWGPNTLIVNGQNSDSILSFGPSEQKFTSLWKRYLLYGHNLFIKKVLASMIGTAFHKKFKLPITKEERERALYDNFKNCLLLDQNDPTEYTEYINHKIAKIQKQFNLQREAELWLYLKFYTYIQGADSQVVISSAKYHNIRLLMPFVSKSFIQAVLHYKNNSIELYKPKYVLKDE